MKTCERQKHQRAPNPLQHQPPCSLPHLQQQPERKGQGWEKNGPAPLASPSTWMCSRYCCWASYSRCWFLSLSSLILMKFSKSPRYMSSRCECRWMMSVATAFRKFLSWDTTRMVDCQVWRRQHEGGLSTIKPELGGWRHHQGGEDMSLPHPFFVSMSSPRPIPVGSSPATELPSHPACSLALREGEKALRSGGMGMAGLYFFPHRKS